MTTKAATNPAAPSMMTGSDWMPRNRFLGSDLPWAPFS